MRKIIYITTALAMLLIISCSKVSDLNLLKQDSLKEKFDKKMPEIKEMSELSFVEYTVTKVIASDNDSKWYGSRKIIYNCVANFKVGIDMSKLKVNIDETNKTAELILPKPEVQGFNMPQNRIRIAYEKNTGFRSKFSNEERLKIKQLGEKDIKKDIAKMGAYEAAKKRAEAFFTALLVEIGFDSSNISFKYE